MPDKHVLIDLENVQPRSLEDLKQHAFNVWVFVGANQPKMPTDLAMQLHELGQTGHYVKIARSGRNALDFHIAYFLGELVNKDPQASFFIVSKDKGFDPLVEYLTGREIEVNRVNSLNEIPALQIPAATSTGEKVSRIVKSLNGLGQSRPRKVKTLKNSINNLFNPTLSDEELDDLVEELKKRKYIREKEGRISYQRAKRR